MSSPNPPAKRIKFLRGIAEATEFEDAAFDLVVFSFVIHECPQVCCCAADTPSRGLPLLCLALLLDTATTSFGLSLLHPALLS